MKAAKIIIVIFFVSISCNCIGQQLFQDASGQSKLFLGEQSFGWLFYNTSDKSATLGYTHTRLAGFAFPKLEANWIYGADFKVKTKEGLGNVISKGEVNPSFTFSGNFGLFTDNAFKKDHFANLYLRPEISYNQYSYINEKDPSIKIEKVKKQENSILVNLNMQFNLHKRIIKDGVKTVDSAMSHFYFVGIQTGYKRANNYNDLDDGLINTTVFTSPNSIAAKSETGKIGVYEGYNTMPLYIDVAATPRILKMNQIGFNAYARTNFFKSKNDTNIGLGVYAADPDKPSSISGGLAWQFNDVANVKDKDANQFERSSIFFYVGYALRK